MKLSRALAIISIMVFASGCSIFSQPTATQPVQTQPPAVETTAAPQVTASPTLTPEQLHNFSYALPFSQQIVQLVDGKYESVSGADVLRVFLSDIQAMGDLNGDGLEDAAVILAENTGGSGTFLSLVVVLNQNGTPIQAGFAQLGDRVKIDSMVIEDQKILMDEVVHTPNDPLCCPTQPYRASYVLTASNLMLTHVSTKTTDGSLRDLTIESPVNGALVSTSVDVKGSFTIGPFENTLSCQLIAEDGSLISQQPIMVSNTEMGAAGTFLAGIDFSSIQPGQKFFVVISDLSAADGSVLTLDAVQLLRQ